MNDAANLVAQRCRIATRVLAVLFVSGQRGKAGIAPDFEWMDGLLTYVERTVRGIHYVQEEACIAKPLERARPDLRPRLGRLGRDHVGAGGYCFRMREALVNWKKGWPPAIDMYVVNARDHHRLSAAHGVLMRRVILPAAQDALSPSQWQTVEKAIAGAADPLSGCLTRSDLEAALCRMMGRASLPAPSLMHVKATNGPNRIVTRE